MMNTSVHQGGNVDLTILFILVVLLHAKPKGRLGNPDGESGKPKKGARPFAVLKNIIAGIQAKMKPRFDHFRKKEGDCIAAWQVQLDPNIHTKQTLLGALDDDNYTNILSELKGDKWNDNTIKALRKRIQDEKHLKEEAPLTYIPDLPSGDLSSSSNGPSGAYRLIDLSPGSDFLNMTPGDQHREQIPDLSLSPRPNSYHLGV